MNINKQISILITLLSWPPNTIQKCFNWNDIEKSALHDKIAVIAEPRTPIYPVPGPRPVYQWNSTCPKHEP